MWLHFLAHRVYQAGSLGRGTLPGPRVCACQHSRQELSKETKTDHMRHREGRRARSRAEGGPGGLLSTWLAVLGFTVMGFASQASLVWVSCRPACIVGPGIQREEDSGRVGRTYEGLVSPSSRPLPSSPSKSLVAALCFLIWTSCHVAAWQSSLGVGRAGGLSQ